MHNNLLSLLWSTNGQIIAFSPNGKDAAVAGASSRARMCDAATGSERFTFDGLKAQIHCLAFSPDGCCVAIGQMYDRVALCDAATGKLVSQGAFGNAKENHLEQLSGLIYSSKSGELLRAAWKRSIDVIDPTTAVAKEPLQPANSTRSVKAVAFFPDGNKLAALWSSKGGRSTNLTIWAWPERIVLARYNHPHEFVYDVAVSAKGDVVAVPNGIKGVSIIDAKTCELIGTMGQNRVHRICFSPCGRLLIGSQENRLCVWEMESQKAVCAMEVCGGSSEIVSLSFSPDGQCLGTGTSRGVKVWRWNMAS
jgi:WD40 repeat protein